MPARIGIIGAGVVGQGVLQLLQERRQSLERAAGGPYEIAGVAVRDPSRPRDHLRSVRVCSPEELVGDPSIDLLIEVAGGVDEPFQWLSRALEAGKKVVTANKALLAERAEDIHALMRKHGHRLFFEAAVAGGIPIIQAVDRGLCANRILLVEGILNGTCNYLLTLMERDRLSFAEALGRAQAKGFAEADPTLDISGGDSAHKLAVLAMLALDRPINASQVFTEGIGSITAFDLEWAEKNGFRVKMLAIARFDGAVELRVHPTLVRRSHLISQVMDEFNAVSIEGDLTGPQLYYGRGAGRFPTASAVVSDVVLALSGGRMLLGRPGSSPTRLVSMGEVSSRHYVHLEVIDQPGVVAGIASAFAEAGISIASMYQPDVAHGSQVPVVFTTHAAVDAKVTQALETIEHQHFLVGNSVHIRMEP